jgi:nucleotide-binding universal stress UspA family protein
VGVDGSSDSQRALEWAVKHAALEHAQLTVLAVNQVAASAWTSSPVTYPEDRAEEEKVRQAAEEAVNKTIDRLGDARPASVAVRGVSGQPAQVLIDASRDADLVVVGARGGGGFARLMTGSVSSQVVNHSASPVVVIPSQR